MKIKNLILKRDIIVYASITAIFLVMVVFAVAGSLLKNKIAPQEEFALKATGDIELLSRIEDTINTYNDVVRYVRDLPEKNKKKRK